MISSVMISSGISVRYPETVFQRYSHSILVLEKWFSQLSNKETLLNYVEHVVGRKSNKNKQGKDLRSSIMLTDHLARGLRHTEVRWLAVRERCVVD